MKDRKADARTAAPFGGSALWLYGYEMTPPHPEHRMAAIRDLLARESREADEEGRNWTTRLVAEPQVTHVMVVTSSPEASLESNQRLEASLRALGIRFQISVPMPIRDGAEPADP